MKTIFFSGSRNISCLNDEIRSRVRGILDKGFHIVVGDANGADKALQGFLSFCGYRNVTVFFSGRCRNNLGNWETHQVEVDSKLRGREFYTQKDKKMAASSDYGLVLWDGKSTGSINNVFELLKLDKCSLVYFSPRQKFHNIKQVSDAKDLLKLCDEQSMKSIEKKINLSGAFRNGALPVQQVLNL